MKHLYLSYPSHDEPFAHRLVEDLQAAGYPVFVDAISEVGTMAWAAETRRAIRTSSAVLMILELDRRRRLGIRHEGIGANRRGKPVYVLVRSAGEAPRYLQRAPQIDFTGEYEAGLRALLAALPPASALVHDTTPATRHRRAYHPAVHARRRLVRWIALLLAVLLLCALLGIVVGVIPV